MRRGWFLRTASRSETSILIETCSLGSLALRYSAGRRKWTRNALAALACIGASREINMRVSQCSLRRGRAIGDAL